MPPGHSRPYKVIKSSLCLFGTRGSSAARPSSSCRCRGLSGGGRSPEPRALPADGRRTAPRHS
eukprot:1501962-Alexandrium_andersonii.AAC.1